MSKDEKKQARDKKNEISEAFLGLGFKELCGSFHRTLQSMHPHAISRDEVDAMLSYIIRGGKLLRLRLFLETCELLSPGSSRALSELGWYIELFQAAALVIDDVADKAMLRRGKECWHLASAYSGVKDGCLALFSIIPMLVQTYSAHPKFKELYSFIGYIKARTITGELHDILETDLRDIDEIRRVYTLDNYYEIVDAKTSTYTFLFPLQLAYLGTCTPLPPSLPEFSLLCGRLFQIQDDFLNFVPGLDKSATDIMEKKQTYFLNCAVAHTSTTERDRERLSRYFLEDDFEEGMKLVAPYLSTYPEVEAQYLRQLEGMLSEDKSSLGPVGRLCVQMVTGRKK